MNYVGVQIRSHRLPVRWLFCHRISNFNPLHDSIHASYHQLQLVVFCQIAVERLFLHVPVFWLSIRCGCDPLLLRQSTVRWSPFDINIMGQGYSLTTLSAGSAGIDIPELSDLVYEKSMGGGRFMKSIRARQQNGLVFVKVIMKPYPSMKLEPYVRAIIRMYFLSWYVVWCGLTSG